MSGPTVAAQGRALLRMSMQGVVNSLRHRQGAGALVVFPLLLTVLLIELARFGAKGAEGVRRFLAVAPYDRGTHFVALWLTVMAVAVVALKYARAIPGRGARPLFDTILFRALPVSPVTRTLFELLLGSTHAAGFVALVFSPALYGLITLRFHGPRAVLLTTVISVVFNEVATLVAHALHALISRYLGGRPLDIVRVVTASLGFLLVGAFSTLGPIGVGFARRIRVGRPAPDWSESLPFWGLVRWARFDDARELSDLALWTAALVLLSVAALVWRVRAPTDISLDGPSAPTGAWALGVGALGRARRVADALPTGALPGAGDACVSGLLLCRGEGGSLCDRGRSPLRHPDGIDRLVAHRTRHGPHRSGVAALAAGPLDIAHRGARPPGRDTVAGEGALRHDGGSVARGGAAVVVRPAAPVVVVSAAVSGNGAGDRGGAVGAVGGAVSLDRSIA
jgi:hypothetical protein